jgi:hypothetical protein
MTRRVLPCLLVLLMPAVGRSEQGGPPDLVPGARVRVTAPASAPKPLTGTISALSDEAITLAIKGRDERVSLSRSSILRLEVSQGRNRRKGLLIGGVAAAAAGAVIGGVGCRDSADLDSWQCATILGGLGFAAGAGLGAIVGAGDHWRDLSAGRPRVTLAPTAGRRPGLSVRLAF